jgi:transposase
MNSYSKQLYSPLWKGYCYGRKASCYDKIAAETGKTGLRHRLRSFAIILRHAISPRFYPISIIRHYGSASILQNRLSWNNTNTGRFIGFKKHPDLKKAAALHNCSKSPEPNAKKNVFIGLLGKIFEHVINTAKSANICSADSTGLENHYVSRHFIMRQNNRTAKYRRWTKLLVIIDNDNHLIGSATVNKGPSTDCHQLKEALEIAVDNMPVKSLLADSGFDSESNHRLCRQQLGINSTIAVNERNLKYGKIGGFFRKAMKRRFPNKKYRQRWQVESVFSRFKRRLGSYLTARTELSRTVECYLRVLTYDLMILYLLFKKSVFQYLCVNVFYKAILNIKF